MKKSLLSSENLNYVAIPVFIVLSVFLLLNHEPYRDEAVQWLIVRDIPNLGSLLDLMGYSGAMGLWPIILFAVAKLGLPYYSMAIIHFLIILIAVVVFITSAPFSKIQKTLFIFGYYPLYEYNAIARSYVLSVLLLFLIASIYSKRFIKPVFYSLLILLLANTNVHSLVMALVLSGIYILELKSRKNSTSTWKATTSLVIIVFGIFIAAYQLWPHPDQNPDTVTWNLNLTPEHIAVIPKAVVGAFLPIPQFKISFWNSTIVGIPFPKLQPKINFWSIKFVDYPTRYLAFLGLPLFLLSLGFFIKKFKPMLIYTLSSAGLFSLFFLKYPGELRHYGLIFMNFIFCLWIAHNYNDKLLLKGRLINKLFKKKHLTCLFTILLLVHVAAASVAFYYELNYDFSAGKKTATFLEENGYINDDTFVATYWSPLKTSILPYIPKPYSKFYFVGYQDFRSFIIGNTEYSRSKNLTIDEILDRVDNAITDKNYSTVILILGKRMIDKGVDSNEKFIKKYHLIASFDKTIVYDESLYVYKLKVATQEDKS